MTLAPGSPFAAGGPVLGVATGQFDLKSNKYEDVAVANLDQNTVLVFLGNGKGSFTEAAGSPISVSSPIRIAVGDFNNDGYPDLAITNNGSGSVTILLGNGDGTFTPAPGSPVAVGAGPEGIASADVNADGKLDLVVVNFSGASVSILLGNGDGTFTQAAGSPIAVGSEPGGIALARLDGDGHVDLVTVDQGDGEVWVLDGHGDGTFAAMSGSPFNLNAGSLRDVAVADFNGDTKADLAVSSYSNSTVTILDGNGGGSFTAGTVIHTPSGAQQLAVGDFAQDNAPSLAIGTSCCAGQVDLWLDDGHGNFSEAPGAPYHVGDQQATLASASFYGDGLPDLAVGDCTGSSLCAGGTPTGLGILLDQLVYTGTISVSGTLQDGQTLSPVLSGAFTNPDKLTYHYQWLSCPDSSGNNCTAIKAATKKSYLETSANYNKYVAVTVTATDVEGRSGSVTAAPVGPVAAPPPPMLITDPVISGNTQAGQVLTTTTGTWKSPDKLRYTYKWQLCDSSGGTCTAITGATSNSYVLTSADVGHDITVVVTATDKENQSGHATATPVGPVTA
jgi:hypothetical protein